MRQRTGPKASRALSGRPRSGMDGLYFPAGGSTFCSAGREKYWRCSLLCYYSMWGYRMGCTASCVLWAGQLKVCLICLNSLFKQVSFPASAQLYKCQDGQISCLETILSRTMYLVLWPKRPPSWLCRWVGHLPGPLLMCSCNHSCRRDCAYSWEL